MGRTLRLFGLWADLIWAILATAVWAVIGVAAANGTLPSTNGLVFVLAMTLVGVSINITIQLVLALLRVGYYSDDATPDSTPPLGFTTAIGMLGLATVYLLDGSLQTMEWAMIGLFSIAGGSALVPSPLGRLAYGDRARSLRDPHAIG